MNALVYSGPEVLRTSLDHVLSTLRSILLPHYSVQTVSQHALITQPWTTACALLVFPECGESTTSSCAAAVKSYVENGGSFLGLGLGAQCVLLRGPFNTFSADLPENGLQFFDKANKAYICPYFNPEKNQTGTISIVNQLAGGERVDGISQTGARGFIGFGKAKNVKILARYVEDGQDDGSIACLRYNVGSGKLILWASNPEYPVTDKSAPSMSTQDIIEAEYKRRELIRGMLQESGLYIPSPENGINPHPPPPHPLPQFLSGDPLKSGIVTRITDAIANPLSGIQLRIFEDENDAFHFHALADSTEILLESSTPRDIDADNSHQQPKHVIICPEGVLPDHEKTPLFNLAEYYSALSSARSKEGNCDTDTWGIGEATLYGEVVTSTQTMLDKNPRLLAILPTPIVSIASHQLAGRGRGSNVWLSPSGCLQFSVLLRVSSSSFPSNKLVFVQYLFALAVVEACRDDTVLGKYGKCVRIKWPNDLYAVVGPGNGEMKKIGGILVNTSFSSGKIHIVIGSGLNVLNPPPITSLSQLLPPGDNIGLSMERTAAAILAKFETMWATFVARRGSFDPFMNLYLERWLHSDQLVTLTTVVPPKRVRITGITADHGLLRTMPERTGWSTKDEGFIDLQPNGNSFDLMAGLIKSKTS